MYQVMCMYQHMYQVICNLDGCHCPIALVLMLDLLHSVLRSQVACLWIGPRLALAARCG